MIVADTSALVSLSSADVLSMVLVEFDVHCPTLVIEELESTAAYKDSHGEAASVVLDSVSQLTIHEVDTPSVESSRIDAGEAHCLGLCAAIDAEFLITDDLRALPELQQLTDAQVALSPIVLRALVKRNCLTNDEARSKVERLAATRDWLGRPIYRRAMSLFKSE
jgi:predicted nucleic acid-binding protein